MPLDVGGTDLRRPLLPERPGAWVGRRARVYLIVLGCVVAGFFFVAGWMATPTEHSGLGGIGLWQAVVAVAALIVAWLSVRWGDRQKGRGGAAGPRFR
jgi:hypothetical protein